MRTLICDLSRTDITGSHLLERLDIDPARDLVLAREELEASRACAGCFGCWVKTPGRCVFNDRLRELPAALGASDELLVVSRVSFGSLSSLAKRGLDRALGYLHPNFRIADDLMRHRLRYDRPLTLRLWLYGDATMQARACMERIAREGARDMGLQLGDIRFVDDLACCRMQDPAPAAPDGGRMHEERPAARGEALVGQPGSNPGDDRSEAEGPQTGGAETPPGAPGTSDAPGAQAAGAPTRIGGLPRKLGTLNASPRGHASATHHLLADFEDALRAYENLSARALGEEADDGLPIVHVRDARDLARCGCDSLLIGYPLYIDALPSGLVGLLEDAARTRALAPGTRVYALANLGFYEPERIEPSFGILREFCRANGLTWCGGLAIGGGGMIVPTSRAPRMGIWRRARSENIDRLIGSVRAGDVVHGDGGRTSRTPADETAGVLHARCPLPRPLYRLAAEAMWRKQARANSADLDERPRYAPDGRR